MLFCCAKYIYFLDRGYFVFVFLIKVSAMFPLAWKVAGSLTNSSLLRHITTSGVHHEMLGYASDVLDVQEGHGMPNETTNASG